MKANLRLLTIRLAPWALAGVVAVLAWLKFSPKDPAPLVVTGNGRLEAVEIDIAAQTPGRVRDLLVREGDLVAAGQVLARLDADGLEAQLRAAGAQLRQAENAVATARSQVLQRGAEKGAAEALLDQRTAEHAIAKKRMARSSLLAREGANSQEKADEDGAQVDATAAAVSAVRAQLVAADAAIATARSQVDGAESAVEAARATLERLRSDLEDTALQAPRDGRVQYLVAQAGEVVGAGGRVLNMVDLSDVHLTFFLPTGPAGRLALGSEVRLVLDAAPQYVIPAHVSFIADVAQFTPKTVETAVEREKLMFRVRARIPPEVLRKYLPQVKTGLPGVAHVRLDPTQAWPARLEVKLP